MPVEEYCDELDAMLSACEEGSPTLDELHGFMSAALCGAREISFREWLCAVFLPDGGDADHYERELPSRLIEMLGMLYEDTRASIDSGSFSPLVSCVEGDDGDIDARQWCRGFLMFMEQDRARWKLDNDRVLELLTPIVLLGDEREFDRALGQITTIGADDFSRQLLEELPSSVCGLRKLFKKRPPARRPVGGAAGPSKKHRSSR